MYFLFLQEKNIEYIFVFKSKIISKEVRYIFLLKNIFQQEYPNNSFYSIISNDANSDGNYYIFISSNNSFNLDHINYNVFDSFDDFSESFPINNS